MKYLALLRELYRLKKNAKKPRAELQALQNKKLRALLQYAWDHSGYYRRSFEEAGFTREELALRPLADLPTIDKAVLMEHFDELITAPGLRQEELRRFDAEEQAGREPYLEKYHLVHSSGSTGSPGYFVYDEAAWQQMLLGIIRGALWGMTMPGILRLLAGRPRILYIAATDGRYGGAMAVGDGIDGVGARRMYLDIKTPLDQWAESVGKFRPNIIIGYPSAIKILAELSKEGQIRLAARRVISCGEPLPPGLRGFLEQAFAAPVVNLYGASESLALGVETGREDGLLLFDDLNVIEVAGDGAMYLTCLYNFAQPLIRYRITDRLVLKEPLPGSPFSRAELLLGRSEDLLWFEDENGKRDFLHPLAVEGFCLPGLRDYQFRQTGPAAFEMLAQVSGGEGQTRVRAEMHRRMNVILKEKQMEYVTFSVRFTDKILPDLRTGKKPLILAGGKKIEEEKAV